MIIAAITGGIFFAIVAAIIYAVSRFAKKHEQRMVWLDDAEDHSASSELRCVTKITTQSNQEGFFI